MGHGREGQLIELIESQARTLYPLIRQLQQQGPHPLDLSKAINSLVHQLNQYIGFSIGEVRVLLGINGKEEKDKKETAEKPEKESSQTSSDD